MAWMLVPAMMLLTTVVADSSLTLSLHTSDCNPQLAICGISAVCGVLIPWLATACGGFAPCPGDPDRGKLTTTHVPVRLHSRGRVIQRKSERLTKKQRRWKGGW